MKNAVLIALLLIGFGFQTNAQGHEAREGRKEMHKKMQDLTPEQRAELKTKRMTLHLDLTEQQQVEIQKLNLELETERSAKRAGKEEKKDSSSEDLYKRSSERLDHRIALKKKLQSILTEEQFAKFQEKHEKKGQRRKNNRKGRNR